MDAIQASENASFGFWNQDAGQAEAGGHADETHARTPTIKGK